MSIVRKVCTILVISGTCLFVKGKLSTMSSYQSADDLCAPEIAACEDDAVCRACTEAYVGVSLFSVGSNCNDIYPASFQSACPEDEGCDIDFCSVFGAIACCGFADSTPVNECMTNPAMVDYWRCFPFDEDCEIDDMPCYNGVLTIPKLSTM